MQGNQYMEIETRSQMITKYDILLSVPHSYQGTSKLSLYSLTQQFIENPLCVLFQVLGIFWLK